MDNKHIQQINRLGYLSLDITCCSKHTVFLELRSPKTIRFSERPMFEGEKKQFLREIEAIIYGATLGIGLELACIGSYTLVPVREQYREHETSQKQSVFTHEATAVVIEIY